MAYGQNEITDKEIPTIDFKDIKIDPDFKIIDCENIEDYPLADKICVLLLLFAIIAYIITCIAKVLKNYMERKRIEEACLRMATDIYLGNITPTPENEFYYAHCETIDFFVESMRKTDYKSVLQQKAKFRKRKKSQTIIF